MKFGCSIGIFLNSAHMICRSTDISQCFRGSFRLRDNESRLYLQTNAHSRCIKKSECNFSYTILFKCEINAKMTRVRKFREMIISYSVFYWSVRGPIFRRTDYSGLFFFLRHKNIHHAKKFSFITSFIIMMAC